MKDVTYTPDTTGRGYVFTANTDAGNVALAPWRPASATGGPVFIERDLMTDTLANLTWSGVTVGRAPTPDALEASHREGVRQLDDVADGLA